MTTRIEILRQAITTLTQALATKKIKVSQRGVTAKTVLDKFGNPVEIVIPNIPDDADESFIEAVQGFVDSECASAAYSDHKAINAVSDSTLQQIAKLVDHVRVENEMCKTYSGSAYNLGRVGHMYADMVNEQLTGPESLLMPEQKIAAKLLPSILRSPYRTDVFNELLEAHKDKIPSYYEPLMEFANELGSLKSTQDSLKVAERVAEVLRTPPSSSSGEGDGDGSGDSKSKSDKKSKSPKSSKGDKEDDKEEKKEKEEKDKEEKPEDKPEDKEEDSEDEGDGDEGDGDSEDDDSEGDGDSDSGDGSDDSDDEGAVGADSGSDTDGDSDSGSESEAQVLLEPGDFTDMNDDVSKKITEAASKSAKDSRYFVLTTEFDRVLKVKESEAYRKLNDVNYEKFVSEASANTATIQRGLEMAFLSKSKVKNERGLRSGKLDASNLYRLRVGDDRVFTRRQVSIGNNVVATLLVDASGSMSGDKVRAAAQSAYALSSVLDRLKITHEVLGFTTGGELPDYILDEYQELTGEEACRCERLETHEIKGFRERFSPSVKRSLAAVPGLHLRNNVDGESLEIACKRLLSQKSDRHIMIVLSDGRPCAYGSGDFEWHLRQVVEKYSKAIDMVGIGIQDNSVKRFYPNSIVINSVKDLPNLVIGQLREMLMKNL